MSPVKRTTHAVYDLKYHFVWIPRYRKTILREDISKRVEEVFREVAKVYEFDIERMAVVEDHVHIFLGAPPKYSPGEIVRVLKSRSAKVVFREFPEVREELWGGEFWSDGYFVRSVGDEVTAEVIRHYIEYHDSKQLVLDF
jgi:putative transposase